MQMPQSLQFEPMKLCGPSVTCLPAGSTLPETSISVLNGAKAKIVKGTIAGRRHHLEVVSVYAEHVDVPHTQAKSVHRTCCLSAAMASQCTSTTFQCLVICLVTRASVALLSQLKRLFV